MDYREFFEVHTNDCGNPTFFSHYDTEELVYLNQAMEKKFQIFEDYHGKTAGEFLPYYDEIRGYENKSDLKAGIFLERTFLSEMLNANLRSKATLWNIEGEKFIQTKYFLAPTNEKRQEAENLFEKAIAGCLEILSDSTLTSPISAFLELLGQFYSSEVAYICEFDREENKLSHRYVWTESGNPSKFKADSAITLDRFVQWLENDHYKSVINLDKNIHDYENFTIEEAIFEEYDIKNITLSKLWNKDGSLMGIVGLSNRAESMYDDRLLQAVSHFVMEQFSRTSMVEALENFNDIDLLTGFYNRNKYAEKLAQLEANPPESLGVLFVNLNGLRKTNEYLGYEEGDTQIQKTASMLNEYFNCEFYRITGDEFVGFVENFDQDIFEETVNSLQARLKEKNHETTFSFGHSWEKGRYTVSNMIKIADTVMVINKQSYYSESLKDMEKVTNSILQDLFRGIAEEEFIVYLQPQVDLKTEEVVGAEALIRRFDKKEKKMIFPDVFIPLYEQQSIIRHIDLFVIRKTCELLNLWKGKGKLLPVSVNLSRVTLMEHGIVDSITEILDEHQISHDLIIIEVTERIGIIENDVATTLVDEFKEQGYKLSLDDFGCAYSNIVTLATISVDEVKIDKSLVDHVLTNPKNAIIVRSMLSMCDELENTHTLAEGIETKEQADFLRSANCQFGQGYLYSRPLPIEDFFMKYIAKNREKGG